MRCGSGISRWWRAALLALALACLGPLPGAQARAEQVTLTPEALGQTISQLLLRGQPAQAWPLARALAKARPQEFSVQLLLSYAARDTGRYPQALAAGKAAWALAADDRQRTDAALAIAQAQSSSGNRTAAQFWLRRAAQVAPDPATRSRVIRDFRYVRARNPWTVWLDFGAMPSSNINGGSGADTITIFGIPFTLSGDAQALSGLETHGTLSVQRTVAESERHLWRLGANLAGKGYQLSSSAKAQAPGAKGSDYAFWAAEAFVGGQIRAKRPEDEWDIRALLGHNEYGGAALSNYASVDFGRTLSFGEAKSLHLGGYLERQWRLDSAKNSATLRFADLEWRQPLGRGRLSLGLTLGQVMSASDQVAHIRKGASLGYALARPVLGADLSLSAGYERRDFGLIPFGTENRTDHRLSLEASALLRSQQFMGFAPEVSLSYLRNRSNSVLSDSRDVSVSVRVKSAF